MKKSFTLILIAVLATSSLVMVIPIVEAAPSIPEFSLKFMPSSYSVTTTDPYTGEKTTQQFDNSTIEVKIKNQPFSYTVNGVNHYLYYNVRLKGHYADEWKQVYDYRNYTINAENPPHYLAAAKNSEYTVTIIKADYPSDAKVDFQVRAVTMYDGEVKAYDHFYDFIGHMEPGYVLGEQSEWSDTQTIQVGSGAPSSSPTAQPPQPTQTPTNTVEPTQNPNLTPTQPDTQTALIAGIDWQTIALIVMAVAIGVMAVGMVVLWRKVTSK